MSEQLGTAVSCTDDLDPLARVIEGEDVLIESFYRRLTTPRGSLITDPDYGTDVRSMLQQGITAADLGAIEGRIRSELEKDERAEGVEVSVSPSSDAQVVTGSIVGSYGPGPFRLVFTLTADTVELLKE